MHFSGWDVFHGMAHLLSGDKTKHTQVRPSKENKIEIIHTNPFIIIIAINYGSAIHTLRYFDTQFSS